MPAATRLHWTCCTHMIYSQHADFDAERFLYEHKLKELIHVRVQVIIIPAILICENHLKEHQPIQLPTLNRISFINFTISLHYEEKDFIFDFHVSVITEPSCPMPFRLLIG